MEVLYMTIFKPFESEYDQRMDEEYGETSPENN